MIELKLLLFHFANFTICLSVTYIMYIKYAYRRYEEQVGNVWRKLGWALMVALITSLIGTSVERTLNPENLRLAVVSRVMLAMFFTWYAVTMYKLKRFEMSHKTIIIKKL